MVLLPTEPGLNRRLLYGDYVRSRNIPSLSTRSNFILTNNNRSNVVNTNNHNNNITFNIQESINHSFESSIINQFTTPYGISNKIGSNIKNLYQKSIVYCKEDVECSICYEKDDIIIRKLKCGHEFNLNCIDLWLTSNKSCPICRYTI